MSIRAASDERSGSSFSSGTRLAIALVVVGIAGFLSWFIGAGSGNVDASLVGSGRSRPNEQRLRSWYEEKLPYWKSAPFTDLNDLPRLTETVAALVGERFDGPTFDQTLLVRDLSTFLHALGAADSREYLERVKRLRGIRNDVYGDSALHGTYRAFSGEPLPRSMTARGLLDLFWVGDSGAVSRPRALAGVAVIQVGRSKPIDLQSSDPNVPLSVQIMPRLSLMDLDEMNAWIGPVWQGLPSITSPTTELKDVLAKHGRTLTCEIYWAFKTVNDEIVPGGAFLFFSPDEGVWQVENAGSTYKSYLFWPF